MPQSDRLFEVPVEKFPTEHGKVDPIEEMAGALCDPIIVFPGGGWERDLPERLKTELPARRLAHVYLCLEGKEKWNEACDLEALLYLYPASLTAPMSERWTRIYLYLGTKCLGDRFPADIRHDSLSDYDMQELRDLKRWIQKQKVKARKERRHQEKAQKMTAVECEQIRLF
jgi:hypothetical protein